MTSHGIPAGGVIALAGALALDAVAGEPPRRVHPVALFGRLVAPADREWRHPRAASIAIAAVFPLAFAAIAALIVGLAGWLHPLGAVIATAFALFAVTSLRRLVVTADRVATLTASDLETARRELRALAGRDGTALTAGQVRSAAVESLPENLADGLVAPLLGFTLVVLLGMLAGVGQVAVLAAGAGAAAWVKSVNTLDSMFGYRDKPVGWASARLDDVVMWLPARTSAALLAVVAADPRAPVAARAWLRDVPSPNAGWPMGTLAAHLDIRLEKPGVYTLNPAGELPTVEDATRAVRLVTAAGVLAYAVAALAVGVGAWY